MAEQLIIARVANRVIVTGAVATPADREVLKASLYAALEALHLDRPELVLDVSASAYLDTSTLACLATFATKAAHLGVRIALEGVNEDLRKTLEVTHMDRILTSRGARVE